MNNQQPNYPQQNYPQQNYQPNYQQNYPQQNYQPNYQPNMPVGQLPTDRSLVKFILLSLITFGIYGIVVWSNISTDINIIASRYDGKNTMHYCLVMFLLAPITCGIYSIVWLHTLSDRIGAELKRRNIPTEFNSATFWLWFVVGSFIFVGPFIYMHKLLTAMNQLSTSYNTYG